MAIINLSRGEQISADNAWVKSAQLDLRKQNNFEQLKKTLNIVEDENKMLRCIGRLENSDFDESARKPLILPKEHEFTWLVIKDCHIKVHHSGLKGSLAELRSRYWVPKRRQTVKKQINRCVTCRRVGGKSFNSPPTASLPEFRVRETFPFSKVGIDFAGPLYVKSKERKMEKVYIALFTCCVTRAVHLELVEDLSSQTFRRALRRFLSRRGTPALIVFD